VLGRTIKVNEATFTIIGVAPKEFNGVSARADVWIPLSMRDLLWPEGGQFHFNQKRDIHWHRVLGRLKPGVTLEEARLEMSAIGARLAQAYPQANRERGVQVISASEAYLGKLRSPLLLLLGAVGCVLLIACANVANLFLIRATARENEMAVRAALGAGRRRLMQQWIVEGALVALLGGALGLLVVGWGVGLLASVLPIRLPAFSIIKMDRGVFAFTAGVSLVTGALLGLVPALRASGKDLIASLKEATKSSGSKRNLRAGGLLVTAETALAIVVMIGAGLLLRSFEQLRHVDPGFQPDHLLMVRFDIPVSKYTGEARQRVGPQIAERVAALPQVQSAALTILDPFIWGGINRGITVEGHTPLTASEQDDIYVQDIGPDYFQTMHIPMRGGRDFSGRDGSSAPHVAIVSHAFAQRYWPGQNPVGKRLKYGPGGSKYGWMEVVGEVGDVRFTSLRDDPYSASVIYAPLMQSEVIIDMSIVARTKTDPASVAGSVREEIRRFDSEIPVYSVATMDERIEGETAATRSFATLLVMFAFLAAGLAAVGIYATMAARVARRTREIGIRMALGAERGAVLRMVLWQGARIALIGALIGLAGAFWLTRYLSAQLYGVRPADPTTFALAAAALSVVALAACWIPARRATRVDPMIALRYE
jgi:putative ABC transport system permease protein